MMIAATLMIIITIYEDDNVFVYQMYKTEKCNAMSRTKSFF